MSRPQAVATTSIAAYHALQAAGLAGQHARLLSHMAPGWLYTRRQLARAARMETSSVSARVNEMLDLGHIEVCGHMHCPVTGKRVEALKLPGEQLNLLGALKGRA